jgi:hypothetical protein
MNCKYCDTPQKGQMQFIEGHCWDCLTKACISTNLPIDVLIGMIKEGTVLA